MSLRGIRRVRSTVRGAGLVAGVALGVFLPAAPALAAPANTQAPSLGWWLGEGVPAVGNPCDAGEWTPAPNQYRFTWVLDAGGVGEQTLATVTTGNRTVSRSSTAANVNHDISCRVEASNDGGSTWSAPLTAQGDPGATLVPALVRVTVNGSQISGDVGGSLTAASTVQVRLRRDAGDGTPREVDSSPVVAIDSGTGAWTATLPARAPADDRDTLVIDYTGPAPTPGSQTSSGVPPDQTLKLDVLSGVRVWVSPAGDDLRVLVPACGQGGACPRSIAHTPWGDVNGVGDNPDPFATSELQMNLSGGPATDQDPITAELFGRFWDDNGALRPATLSITKAAPMLGAGDLTGLRDASSPQQARSAPQCIVLLYDVRLGGPGVSCYALGAGAGLQLLHRRGATTLQTVDFTADGGPFTTPLDNPVQTGDVVTLRMAGAPQRVLAEVTAGVLRLDLGEKAPDGWGDVAGECSPGRWIGAGEPGDFLADKLCGPTGSPIGNETNELRYRDIIGTDAIVLQDDRAGGGTAVAPPSVIGTVPADGAATSGAAWTAYADTDAMAFPWSGSGPPAVFSYRPRTDPLSTDPFTVLGNANTTSGTPVSGVAPGRYEARWVVTDPHGDSRSRTTFFFQQPLVPGLPGPIGPAGPQGSPGPIGPVGPAGPAGTDARVVVVAFRVRVSARRVTVSYALTGPCAIKLTATRGKGKAVTVATAEGKAGLNTIVWNRKLAGKRAKPGTYRLKVTATAGGRTVASVISVRLR